MDVAHPYKAVCPTLDGDVLMALAGSKMGMTGRQVAALTGRSSHSGVLNVLNRLTEQGVVDRVELTRAYLFSLNRDHLAYPAVIALLGLRITFIGGVQETIKTWKLPPIHGSLFGSFARGDGDAHSDIDLFLVRPAAASEEDDIWREQLDELALTITRSTGNRASIHEVSESELPRLRTDPPPIVAQLRSDAIHLSGPLISALLGSE
jgi:Nucleotidyltransferase domain